MKFIKWIGKKVKSLFSKLFSEKKAGIFVKPVLQAAQAKAYIETVSDKADALHRFLKELYEEDLQENYLQLMKKLAPKFRRGKVRLAIDKHEVGYYGKKNGFYIVGTAYGNKSYSKAFEYLSISLLIGKKEERIHLYALPWHIGCDLVSSVAMLLNSVKKWFDKIEVVQFDRGFDSWELVDWLNKEKIPYLIHKRKFKGKLETIMNNTKSFYRGNYKGTYRKDKSLFPAKTNLYVCKNIKEKDWLFLSSINFTKKEQLVSLYRNRWQIETNYAISNQNRIMSKSINALVRYFYFLCDILLQVLWRLSGFCFVPFKIVLRCFAVGIKEVLLMKPRVFKPPDERNILNAKISPILFS